MQFCFLDCETTGFDAEKDSIIEISFLVRDENTKKIVKKFDEVIFPEKTPLTPFVSNLTGISEEEISKNAKEIADVRDEILEKIGDSTIVGHNIDFDIGFLAKNGVNLSTNPRIDTHELSRILLPGETSFALEALAEKYGFSHHDAHRAMSDVEASLELFDFLVEKISKLPSEFLAEIREFLQSEKCEWSAANLFLSASGSKCDFLENSNSLETENSDDFEELADEISDFSGVKFIRAGNSVKTANFARKIAKRSGRSVIISSKLSFFSGVRQFPTPEVLLDREKLKKFVSERKKIGNSETTFFLKCKFRDFLGHRGMNFFDLFFQEREFWREVCADEQSEVFKKAVEDRLDEPVLACSGQAFLRFCDLPIFKNRTVIVDEAEIFAKNMLFFDAREVSLKPLLDADDEISVPAHFWVTRFCREVIEKKLDHAITPFAQKLLLERREFYPEFAKKLLKIAENPATRKVAEILTGKNQDAKITRWVKYFPDTGNLIFGSWNPDSWAKRTADFSKKFSRQIWFHRADLPDEFLRIFCGVKSADFLEVSEIRENFTVEIPKNLKSANSVEYPDFVAEKIIELATKNVKNGKNLAVNFASGETLKNIFSRVLKLPNSDRFSWLGERVSGGSGKILAILPTRKNLVFFQQKFLVPELENLNFRTVATQKFPFDAPDPLLESVEKAVERSGRSFFEIWTIPQTAANLARRISAFGAEKVVFFDPRENTGWGIKILRGAFGKNFKRTRSRS